MSATPAPPPAPPLGALLRWLAPSWPGVLAAVFLGALTVGSSVGLMATSAYLISAAALRPSVAELSVAIVGVRAFGLARGVLRYAERYVSHSVSLALLARLRVWFYARLEPLAPARLERERSGDLLARLVGDIDSLQDFFVRAVAPPLAAALVALGTAAWLASLSPWLALVALAGLALGGLALPAWVRAASAGPARAALAARAGLAGRLVDGLQGLADLLAFGQGARFEREAAEAGAQLAQTQRRLARVAAAQAVASSLTQSLGLWLVLSIGAGLVSAGQLPGVLLAAAALGAAAAFEAVLPLPAAAQSLALGLAAAGRLQAVIAEPPPIAGSEPVPPGPLGLEVSGLRFAYAPGDPPALDGLALCLPPGGRVALVGPSGAGKSTLIALLLGFWPYAEGSLLLGGREVRDLDPAAVRASLAIAPQDPYLFNATLAGNLRLARPQATEAELWQALERAQLSGWARALPEGLDTRVGELGARLSGGERQRLGLAQALLRDAPLLVLDEPTAHLDPALEQAVMAAVLEAARGRALLLCTHRLRAAGLDVFDEIIVLDHGRVVQRGPHAALLAEGGLYARLWAADQN